MVEFVVNQLRTHIFECTENSRFTIKTVKYQDIHIGESLYVDGNYIGLYKTYKKALQELCELHNRNDEIYGASGYSDEEFAPELKETTLILGGINI